MRLIGVLLVCVSALFCGFSLQRSYRERTLFLGLCVALVCHVRRKIDLFGSPASQLFSDFEFSAKGSAREALQKCIQDESLGGNCSSLLADCKKLKQFLKEIRNAYREEALHLCDHYCAMFETAHKESLDAYDKKKKLYFALPVLLAFSVLVLIL